MRHGFLKGIVFLLVAAFAAMGSVQAGDKVVASGTQNPPPEAALVAYDRFEMAELAMGKPYAGQPVNDKARDTLAVHLNGHVLPWVLEKSTLAAKNEPPRLLRIEPRIDQIKTVSKGARFWAGAMAGKSRVLVKVRLVDAASNALIAEPEFYQHAGAMAGAYSMGAADQGMLERVAQLVVEYLRGNYDAAVGGPTGMPEK